MKERILIMEDETAIQSVLYELLTDAGYEVSLASDGLEGISLFQSQSFSLILLDIMMPKIDGYAVCEFIRKKSRIPIIMLTAMDEEEAQIRAFELQVDDYITKPFSVPLLVRRIQAVLNRSLCRDGRFYYNGDLCYDFDGKELKIGEKSIPLTPTEMRLLEVFLHNRRRVLTREMLLARVWDAQENYVDDKALAVNIRRLREKIEKEPGKPERIKTVFGIGYKWEEE